MRDSKDIHPVQSEGHSRLLAFIAGRSEDPFAIMGPHEVAGIRTVTVFDPGAAAIEAA